MTTVPNIPLSKTSPIQQGHPLHRFLLGSSLHVHWIRAGFSISRRDSTSSRIFGGMLIPLYDIVPL